MTTSAKPGALSAAMIFLFAIVAGTAVGNLYLAQPLLATMAQSFGVSVGLAGILVTVTQMGYALGILLIVPLGDIVNRRRLIPAVMSGCAVALVGSAAAPSFWGLLAALGAVGMTTVAGQLLVPLAGDLARPELRGRVVGTVVAGILIGILLSRTVSGIVADAFGWRAIFVLAAAIAASFALVLLRALPDDVARPRMPYGLLLVSVTHVVRAHRSVVVTLVICASGFLVFSMFWTGLTFLLSSPPFSYSLSRIGLVGLVGVAGALVAQPMGRLHDRGHSTTGTGAALLLALASLGLALFGAHSIVVIVGAVLLLDIAMQGIHVLGQTRLFAIDPKARSRLNTALVASNFVGGAFGSALAGVLWDKAGWHGVVTGAIVVIAIATAVWAAGRKTLLGVEHRVGRSDK
jgi:predicted MFS family arabinose efflux permease